MKPSPESISKSLIESTKLLVHWYHSVRRDLPWRNSKDPYRIWISEVMLQQTTVVAVIPYYERFLKRFSTVEKLANAELSEVYEMWSGLGYYSRARNLHKAAQIIHSKGFPKTAEQLIELPGFGPYTSRAVASLAFDQPVGVLDGNVIRVLCRFFGWEIEWWNKGPRDLLQKTSDQMASSGSSHDINQAMMELGATVCTPHNPTCLLCPWQKKCVAYQSEKVPKLPLKKPRRAFEIWVWDVQVKRKAGKVAMQVNNYTPFLKGQIIFPGKIKKHTEKPKNFDLSHGITHHQIYIRVHQDSEISFNKAEQIQWLKIEDIKKVNPSNLLQKIINKLN